MSDSEKGRARAVADLNEGLISCQRGDCCPRKACIPCAEFRRSHSLVGQVGSVRHEEVEWRSQNRWSMERVGSRYGKNPYSLEGEFTVVEIPRTLAHTWRSVGSPEASTTVSYRLDEVEGGTRITLHHTGFSLPEIFVNTALGWETSFDRLAQVLRSEPK
jgi:Activator of Hsp90 ATPase homolog 1-like protein